MDLRHRLGPLHRLLGRLEEAITLGLLRGKRALGILREIEATPYYGFGAGRRVVLQGRILERKEPIVSGAEDSRRRNFQAMADRFLTLEIPRAQICLRVQGSEHLREADSEGYLHLDTELPQALPAGWSTYEMEVQASLGGSSGPATGRILTPAADADYIIVSDIDDTVLPTYVTNLFRMLRVVLLSNAHTRTPFPGVAELYRGLRAGPGGTSENPIFYLSKSPWNLFELLVRFMELNDIPPGPLLLRDFGFSRQLPPEDRVEHKLEQLRMLLELYPQRFVLIGDCGEKDPEVYATAAAEHPGQISAIFIRCPGGARESDMRFARQASGAGSPMHFVQNSHQAAIHAAGLGLVPPEVVVDAAERQRREAHWRSA